MMAWICTTLVNFLSPMQGPARLYAYLKKEGHDVRFKDLNQDIYFTLLSKEYLKEIFEKIKGMLYPATRDRFLRENIGSILLNSSAGNIKRLPGIAGSKVDSTNIIYELLNNRDSIISNIDKAREILDKRFLGLSMNEFISHFKTLLCGKALIDAVFYPAQLDFGLGFQGTAYRPHARDIMHAVSDERHNYLILYYRNKIAPLLDEEKPDVVGISVTHTSEFIPAFTLASMIKKKHPGIHICLGGATVTEVAGRISANPQLWNLFDSLILGPGEHAFGELMESVEKKKDLSKVPNLIYKNRNAIKKSRCLREFNLDDACTPEYVNVRPKSILSLEASSGCYWGRCIFCYYPKEGVADVEIAGNIRTRKIELVLEDIKKLSEKYDPSYISITDSALHPNRIERIAEENIKSGRRVRFSAFVRFEKEFTSPRFSRKLARGGFLGGQVGLESGSQRSNDIINKGTKVDEAKIILKNFYNAGILMHLYTIVGLPWEKKEEAISTFLFLKRHRRLLTLDWQIYPLRILEHSPMAKRAGKFNLKTEPFPNEFLFQLMNYKAEKGMSQRESAAFSVGFYEKLKRYMHPLSNIMDIEMYKEIILATKAK